MSGTPPLAAKLMSVVLTASDVIVADVSIRKIESTAADWLAVVCAYVSTPTQTLLEIVHELLCPAGHPYHRNI